MFLYVWSLLFGTLLLFGFLVSDAAPVTGNPNGNVTLIEYYDYECPHCRRMESVIDHLQDEYPNLHVVCRVVPLLNPTSYRIARFALAAAEQGQWEGVHYLLMQSSTAPTISTVKQIIAQLKLPARKLLQTMRQPQISEQISTNIKLAERYAIQGAIYLPILVFKSSHGKGQAITLTGERSYALLSAVVTQLEGHHVSMAQRKN